MGSKSQRRKELYARKQREKREKRKKRDQSRARRQEPQRGTTIALGSNARHRQRLSQQVPLAWAGEIPEDVAMFDDLVLATLPPELADQVTVVREALQDISASRGDEALKRVSAISRGSPLSEWRLLIRGLADWLADDIEAANDAWKRLDPERRPGRIATAMMIARRSDLENLSPLQGQEDPGAEAQASARNRCDDQLLYHAKLLRRVRFDRAALRVAESGLSILEESKELLLGPRKIDWLRRFVAEYGATEPDLASALAQTALGRAFAQNYSNIFDEAARLFEGPRHDRRNRLLTFFYYSRFANDASAEKRAARALDEFLNRDLPRNEALSAPLRAAIASQIHLSEARALMRPGRGGGMMDLMFRSPENTTAIREHLLASVKADPANGPAYKAHAEWIESKLDDERLPKPKRIPLEKELAEVMRSWSQGLSDAVEPRLWLVDHLLENEQLEEARPHVEFLAASRHDDPRVRATPWKWRLLEAMRLCRRKAWLAEVPARLAEAETLWPAWLSRQWLPYLKVAWTLRNGETEVFEEQRRQLCQESGLARDSLADACMMLGAAQRMCVSAPDLKEFRAFLDRVLKQLDAVPLEDLIETGGFFWDLHRAQLLYPAYRMHGKSIGKALLARLAKATGRILNDLNDQRVHKAILWASEYRFWSDSDQTKLPSFFSTPGVERHPIFAAARLNAFLKERYIWAVGKYRDLGPLLHEAAQSQRDAYYRYWFIELAEKVDDVPARNPSRFSGFPFGDLFGNSGEDEDDDNDDDNGLRFDPDCDCPECQAAKRAAEQTRSADSLPF